MDPIDLPEGATSKGVSPEFDGATVPAALLSRHALAAGAWARLRVFAGELTFVDLRTGQRSTVAAGGSRVVPPLVPHRVEVGPRTRLQLEFFREAE